MKIETVRIPEDSGALAGLFYTPDSDHRPLALVLAHGFTSGKYSMDHLAGYLASRGYECLTFDFVGHKLGASEGRMERVEQVAENMRDALAWLRTHTRAERVVLGGHSMGAAATLQTAAWDRQSPPSGPPLAGLICICMGREPARSFDSALGQAMLAQRSDYVTGAPALELLTGLNTLVLSAQEVGPLPALFLAARQDVLVSIARVEELAALVGPHAIVTVLDATHLDAPDRARGPVANWLQGLR